ncbi:MAG: 50S ribosome-binding GTPase [Candidatus Pacearchaeota archaeon]|nr:50S ribosome-binding GTPase [Candidatus Pacearchaeota archaeon]
MSSTNQSPQYQKAAGMYLRAQTNEEKLKWLEEMMRECPKHKSAEKMLANLKTRHIKLKEKIETIKKTSKGSKKSGIKKEDLQAVIIGFTNSGKSSLLSRLTNANPEISEYPNTTKTPAIGMMKYSGTNIQLIEIPAIASEYYDKGLVNSADVLVILIENIKQAEDIKFLLPKASGKQIIAFNKTDLLNENDKRKTESTLKSRKYNFVMISAKTGEGIDELKNKIFESFGKLRIFTKEPGKQKTEKPFVMENGSKVKDIALKIFKSSSKIKETKIWGPSSKFPGQKVGLEHELKDLDVVEFKTN